MATSSGVEGEATTESKKTVGSKGFRLIDASILIVAVAAGFALLRDAKGFEGKSSMGEPIYVAPVCLGAVLTGAAVWFMLLQTYELVRAAKAGRRTSVVARLAVFGAVWALVYAESEILKLDPADNQGQYHWMIYRLRRDVFPICLGLAILGALLTVVPGRRRAKTPKRPRTRMPDAVLAGVGGAAVLAAYIIMIAFMVLISVEAVTNALHYPASRQAASWPSLADRLARVGRDAAIGLAICAIAAGRIHDDVRRRSSDPERAYLRRTRAETAFRLVLAALAWAAFLHMTLVDLPYLHRNLADGFFFVTSPECGAIIATAFGMLAAGLLANGHSAAATAGERVENAPLVDRQAGGLWRRLFKAAICVMLLEIIVSTVASSVQSRILSGPWYAPWGALQAKAEFLEFVAWTNSRSFSERIFRLLVPETLVLLVLTVRILAALTVWSASRRSVEVAPVDFVLSDRRIASMFFADWITLTGVLLAMLPILLLGSFAVFHTYLMATG